MAPKCGVAFWHSAVSGSALLKTPAAMVVPAAAVPVRPWRPNAGTGFDFEPFLLSLSQAETAGRLANAALPAT